MSEKSLLDDIRLAFSEFGARIFRNNTGMGWVGKSLIPHKKMYVEIRPGDVLLRQARPLQAGLCEGSSDLIGWTPIVINESHLGRKLALFTAVEGKYGKTATTKDQKNFIDNVNKSGGIGAVVRSKEEALGVISWTRK